MSLAQKYYRQLKRDFNWHSIVEEAKSSFEQDYVGRCFLGKYYTPWAKPNVDPCRTCQGTGHTKRKYACLYCSGSGIRSDSAWLHAAWVEGNPMFSQEVFPCWICGGSGFSRKECQNCGGLGSHEAYQDQEFMEQLEKIADEYGGWIESGKDDPRNLFFVISVEPLEYDN